MFNTLVLSFALIDKYYAMQDSENISFLMPDELFPKDEVLGLGNVAKILKKKSIYEST